ncbi:MAG TPA: hypothetical protein PLJ74_05335 [Myxococcota bacterium]|nr:hypothetical protein [Myxococcota bacterium]
MVDKLKNYIVKNFPDELHKKARRFAFENGTTLRWLILNGLEMQVGPIGEVVAPVGPLQEADDSKAWNRKPPEKEEEVEIEKPKQETPLERATKRAEAMKRGDATAIKRNGDTPPAE